MNIKLTDKLIIEETEKIVNFLKEKIRDNKAVIGVSGGLDSDATVRLTAKAIGAENLKLFIVIQDFIEEMHIDNAVKLANDLGVDLVKIEIPSLPTDLIRAMQDADPVENFNYKGLLDPARAKCSIRTAIFSTYQDRGYIVVGTSNRTEYETGFFLPFGDGIAHLKPLLHLYKTQVIQIAENIGTQKVVISQPASAGFWKGQTDLEDLAFWIFNKGPIGQERNFTKEDINKVNLIKSKLRTDLIDVALKCISENYSDDDIAEITKMSKSIITNLRALTINASILKHRKINEKLC